MLITSHLDYCKKKKKKLFGYYEDSEMTGSEVYVPLTHFPIVCFGHGFSAAHLATPDIGIDSKSYIWHVRISAQG